MQEGRGVDAVAKVSAGSQLFCSLHDNGDVRCWGGSIVSGTPGYGTTDRIGDEPGEMPPPALDLGQPALNIWVGGNGRRVCALLADQSAVCWGGVFGLESPWQNIGDEPGEMPPPPLRLYE